MRVIAFAVAVVALSGCGLLSMPDTERLSAEEWAVGVCKAVGATLDQLPDAAPDGALAQTLNQAIVELDTLEPADGAGRLHDVLTDQLELMSRKVDDLTNSDATPAEVKAEWTTFRDDSLASVAQAAETLSADARAALDPLCGGSFLFG